MIGIIARHELRRHVAGLNFWIALAVAQFLVAWLFFAQLDVYTRIAPQLAAGGSALDVHDLVLAPTLASGLLVVLFLAPMMTMQSLAGELRAGRMVHWLGLASSSHRVIVGKLLGNWIALSMVVGSLGLTLASLGLGMPLDYARLGIGLLGLLLAAFAFTAFGLFFSSLTRQPAIAFTGALGCNLFLWLLDSFLDGDGEHWLALLTHFTPLQNGLVRSTDLVYFLLAGLVAAWLASFRLAIRRGEF